MNHPQSPVKACGVVHRLWASPDSRHGRTSGSRTCGDTRERRAQPSIRRVEQNPSTLIVATAADAVFNERRLAEIYGPLEPDRPERAKAVKVTPYKGVNYAAIMQAGLEADTARRAKCGPNVLRSVALRGRRGLPQPTVASCRCC